MKKSERISKLEAENVAMTEYFLERIDKQANVNEVLMNKVLMLDDQLRDAGLILDNAETRVRFIEDALGETFRILQEKASG